MMKRDPGLVRGLRWWQMSLTVFVGAWLLVASARADDIGPDDQYCEVEVQRRDGSQCEVCEVSIAERQSGANPCAQLEAREGWSQRCSVGATHQRIVYCDREANFVAVGRRALPSGVLGCGCRAAGAPGGADAFAIGALFVGARLWARRRRAV